MAALRKKGPKRPWAVNMVRSLTHSLLITPQRLEGLCNLTILVPAGTILPDSANPTTGRQWEGRTRALEEGERNMQVLVYPLDIEEVRRKQSDPSTLREMFEVMVGPLRDCTHLEARSPLCQLGQIIAQQKEVIAVQVMVSLLSR
jgi:hypothetical protein